MVVGINLNRFKIYPALSQIISTAIGGARRDIYDLSTVGHCPESEIAKINHLLGNSLIFVQRMPTQQG